RVLFRSRILQRNSAFSDRTSIPALLSARCAGQRHKYRLSQQPPEKSARSHRDHFFAHGESGAIADADFGPEVASYRFGLSPLWNYRSGFARAIICMLTMHVSDRDGQRMRIRGKEQSL